MDKNMMETIAVAIIGSGALSTVISAIINAISKRSKLKKLEKDTTRLQLLFLMYVIPDEQQELMTVAQYYFQTLKSDWYMTSLFAKWRKKNGLERPDWFTGGKEE